MFAEDAADCGANQLASDGVCTFQFAFVFELELAGDGGECGINIRYASGGVLFTDARRTLLGVANDAFQGGDREALAHTGAAIHALVFARLEGDFLDNFAQVGGQIDFASGVAADPGFLLRDGHAFFEGGWVVRADFRADAVFQRRNDFAAGRVVFRIRGEYEQDIEGQAERVALNLNVAFLHDVEQADLNFSGEVWEFVDGEDAAVGAGQQAVVNGQFVGEVAATAGGANGIDVADNVGDGDVGSSQLFDEALVARHPRNRRVVALLGDFLAAGAADRAERIIVDFTAGYDGDFRVEQLHEAAQNAALGLSAQTQKNEIVAREERVDDLGHDGVFVAVNAGKERFVSFDGAQQIAPHLVLHGKRSGASVVVGNAAQFADGARLVLRSPAGCCCAR